MVGGIKLRLWNILDSMGGRGFYSLRPPNKFYSPLAKFGQSESATWHSLIGPLVCLCQHPAMSLPSHLPPVLSMSTSSHLPPIPATSSVWMPCHRMDDTWHFFIGPHGPLKMPKMSDTWKPLMLPHHPIDINMTSSVSCMTCTWTCHVASLL
jgi:hypothetical protein